MARNLRLVFLGAVITALVGCAGSPSKPIATSQAETQKRQAFQVKPLGPEDEAQMEKARAAMQAGQWQSADSLLVDLKNRRPKVSEIHASLGWVAHQQGDTEQAAEAYRRAFELNPNDAASANNLALLLREQGRFKEAVATLQEGLEYSPQVPDLHYNLAVIAELYLLDLELALAHYRRFQALNAESEQQVAGWIADLERRLN